jgi:hypothetical protein
MAAVSAMAAITALPPTAATMAPCPTMATASSTMATATSAMLCHGVSTEQASEQDRGTCN